MKKLLISLLVLFAGVTGFVLWATSNREALNINAEMDDSSQGEALIGGDFNLIDVNGKAVGDADFRGRYMMVFFGFTNCPDICPVTVASLSQMMEILGDKASSVAPVFITVDPARDTPQAMKDYLSNFDPRIIGLTGSAEQVQKAAAAYKAYYSQEPAKSHADASGEHGGHGEGHEHPASVNHSGYVYLMSPEGQYIRHFPYDAPAQTMADALLAAMK
jgi:cytochrome oxidase Cu insertion factor (SCO1/SenC/PrrC family)